MTGPEIGHTIFADWRKAGRAGELGDTTNQVKKSRVGEPGLREATQVR